MSNLSEEIKKKVDVVEFIGSYITLKKSGRNFKGNCPFHQEKTPSFIVSPERQIWHCFGSCGEGGDVIKFLMKWENITFLEALREFAEKYGLSMDDYQMQDTHLKVQARLYLANRYAVNFYSYMLFQNQFGSYARQYLKERRIGLEIAKTFELGYAPSSWNSLSRFMLSRQFTQQELIDAGLVLRSSKGSIYDRFRGRLIFPIKDTRNNIIGFSGRILDNKDKTAKYVNTPETTIYHKRESLYGINLSKEAIKREKCAILVEGEFDMIAPYQYGIEHIVAIKGSSVTKEQLMLLKRYTTRIYLALDADQAGAEAIKRGIEEAENLEFELGIIRIDYAKDPDEAVQKDLPRFKKIIRQPQPVYDYIIDFYRKKYPDNDAFSKKNIGEAVVPFLLGIKNPIVESHYIKKLASLLDVSEGSVRQLLQKKIYKKSSSTAGFKKIKDSQVNREDVIQRYFLSSVLQYEEKRALFEKLSMVLSYEDFSFPAYQKLYKRICEQTDSFEINTFASSLPTELKKLLDELYLFASFDTGVTERNMGKLAYEIKERALKRRMQILLSSDNTQNTESELTRLSTQLKELEKKTITI
ncbi:MAG: DNA primase [Patescibacteria group bacterium]